MAFFRRCDAAAVCRGQDAANRYPRAFRALTVVAACLPLLTAPAGAFGETQAPSGPAGAGEPAAARILEPGATAPGFVARDTDGAGFPFEVENQKYPYLLVFWSVFCEPCRLQLAADQILYDKYRDAGLRVAAIALDGEPLRSVVVGFVRQEGYTFQVVLDEFDDRQNFRVAEAYGVSGMPSTFLVDRGGRIVFSRTGLVKTEELENSLQTVLRP